MAHTARDGITKYPLRELSVIFFYCITFALLNRVSGDSMVEKESTPPYTGRAQISFNDHEFYRPELIEYLYYISHKKCSYIRVPQYSTYSLQTYNLSYGLN
jgi:hypothetical protein